MKFNATLKGDFSGKFTVADFVAPPLDNHPAYSWMWNSPVTEKLIAESLDKMSEQNIKVVYIIPEPKEFRPTTMPTTLEPPYLSEEFHALVRYTIEYAVKKHGMRVWLYDEGGWPSGSANGEVVAKNPELRRQYIDNEGNIVAEKLRKGIMQPDLMNRRSTEEFIRITHESYRSHIGDFFGKEINIAFTDEPTLAEYPWSEGFGELFRERYGYSIEEYLPALSDANAQGERICEVRIDYRDLCGELFCENYFKRLQAWCSENKLLSVGHINGEDRTLGCIDHGFVHAMRMLRCFDIPGVDAIWRQIFPCEKRTRNGKVEGENLFFPRYASSAASQTGVNKAVTESFAIYGAGLTYEQMRYVLNFQAVRGINLFNFMSTDTGYDEYLMAGARPSFMPLMPGASDKAAFNEYTARLSYVMSLGKPEISTALYMPMRDFWALRDAEYYAGKFEEVGFALERAQVSFDIFDDDAAISAEDTGSGLLKLGIAEYSSLVIPECGRMSPDTLRVIEEFIKGGGRVYTPFGGEKSGIRGAICGMPAPVVKLSGKNENIRAAKRVTLGGDSVYFIYNEGLKTEDFTFSLEHGGKKNIYRLGLREGEIFTVPCGDISLSLHSGEEAVYLCTDGELDSSVERKKGKLAARIGEFNFRRTRSFVIGEHSYESREISEEPTKVAVSDFADWTEYVGREFSGDAVYEAEFDKPCDGDVIVRLGDVRYSCELFINGESMGIGYAAPFEYVIDGARLGERNRMAIRVSNTAANQFVSTKSFDKWSYETGPYHAVAKTFEADSVSGGLCSPVEIYEVE